MPMMHGFHGISLEWIIRSVRIRCRCDDRRADARARTVSPRAQCPKPPPEVVDAAHARGAAEQRGEGRGIAPAGLLGQSILGLFERLLDARGPGRGRELPARAHADRIAEAGQGFRAAVVPEGVLEGQRHDRCRPTADGPGVRCPP